MRSKALLLAGSAIVATTACTPVDAGFGEAQRYDMAVQTVNPDPVYPEDGAKPGDSGHKGAEAVKAYRKGQTKALRIESSSAGSGGAGAGASPGN